MVLDTHVFLWYCLDDPRLPSAWREELRRSPQKAWVPTICLWECVVLAQKGRIQITSPDPARAVLNVFRRSRFNEAPLTSEIAVLSRSLAFEHEDPADRFIAATAVAMSLPLASVDARLTALPFVSAPVSS